VPQLGSFVAIGGYSVKVTSDVLHSRPILADGTLDCNVKNETGSVGRVNYAYYHTHWTKDKIKKAKRWESGVMRYDGNTRMALFYGSEDVLNVDENHFDSGKTLPFKCSHRKKYPSGVEPTEGEVIDAPSLLIEISSPVQRVASIKAGSIAPAHNADEASRSDETSPLPLMPSEPDDPHRYFELLYTEDKQKKLKRWKDGTVHWKQGVAIFYNEVDEDGKSQKVLFRRKMQSGELHDGVEISTAQFLFQIGPAKTPPPLLVSKEEPVKSDAANKDQKLRRKVGLATPYHRFPQQPMPQNTGRSTADLIGRLQRPAQS
jgi:hypothetical protein